MLRLASKLCLKSDHKAYRHGVVICRGGAVISSGYNYGHTHAEDSALSKMWPSERRGCKLWSIRVTKSGKYANAKPCEKCLELIRSSGIKTVYYSNENGDIKRMKVA